MASHLNLLTFSSVTSQSVYTPYQLPESCIPSPNMTHRKYICKFPFLSYYPVTRGGDPRLSRVFQVDVFFSLFFFQVLTIFSSFFVSPPLPPPPAQCQPDLPDTSRPLPPHERFVLPNSFHAPRPPTITTFKTPPNVKIPHLLSFFAPPVVDRRLVESGFSLFAFLQVFMMARP